MGNANRFRRGTRDLIKVGVASATVVEKGDFVLIESGLANTPSLKYPQGSEAALAVTARSAAAQVFGGIAEDASAAGDTAKILVDISHTAIYELVQATAADISIGDLIEMYSSSTASASWTLSDDTIAAGSTNPIAVCVEDHDSAEGTGVLCKLLPQKLFNDASWM